MCYVERGSQYNTAKRPNLVRLAVHAYSAATFMSLVIF